MPLVPYILILAHKNKNLMKGTWVCGFPALVPHFSIPAKKNKNIKLLKFIRFSVEVCKKSFKILVRDTPFAVN